MNIFIILYQIFIIFFKILFYFLERGRERERKGEKHQCVVTSHASPTGDLAHNPGMCPRLGFKLATLWFAGQCSTTEPHQPWLIEYFYQNLSLLFWIYSINNSYKFMLYSYTRNDTRFFSSFYIYCTYNICISLCVLYIVVLHTHTHTSQNEMRQSEESCIIPGT